MENTQHVIDTNQNVLMSGPKKDTSFDTSHTNSNTEWPDRYGSGVSEGYQSCQSEHE